MKPELTLSAMTPDWAATTNRDLLARSRVLAVALVGPPGAGKTALIEATARQLRGKARVAVVALNPAAQRDADRVSRYCAEAEGVNTASPDAIALCPALKRLDLAHLDVVFIESVGGIAGVPDLGQDATVTVLSVSGGDDKAAEYAQLLIGSAVLVLTKAELRRHVRFDRGVFRADLRRINPTAELIEVSAFENTGLPRWLEWLDRRRQLKNPRYQPVPALPPAECFLG